MQPSCTTSALCAPGLPRQEEEEGEGKREEKEEEEMEEGKERKDPTGGLSWPSPANEGLYREL